MSNLQSSANKAQMIELLKSIKIPILGAGGGFAPIGFYGWSADYVTGAPQGWLRCEGQEVNIADYPELATFYASQHGASNYWGGDGITTFAVPDLRGEFIRGAGTNSHTNQGDGGAVGEHQDGTEIPFMSIRGATSAIIWSESTMLETKKEDSKLKQGNTVKNVKLTGVDGETGASTNAITTRPTNTSGAFFVKATVSDAEINAFNVYTPREHQVAWWEEEIDGVWKRKPVYEKRVDCGALPNNAQKTITHNIENIDMVISCRGFCVDSYHSSLNIPHISTSQGQIGCYANRTTLFVYTDGNRTDFNGNIAIQYTKTTDQWQTS